MVITTKTLLIECPVFWSQAKGLSIPLVGQVFSDKYRWSDPASVTESFIVDSLVDDPLVDTGIYTFKTWTEAQLPKNINQITLNDLNNVIMQVKESCEN